MKAILEDGKLYDTETSNLIFTNKLTSLFSSSKIEDYFVSVYKTKNGLLFFKQGTNRESILSLSRNFQTPEQYLNKNMPTDEYIKMFNQEEG